MVSVLVFVLLYHVCFSNGFGDITTLLLFCLFLSFFFFICFLSFFLLVLFP